jgi:hypothetical protein
MYGQKTRLSQAPQHAKPGDVYPIKVHISGLHYRSETLINNGDAEMIYADAVMDGKKIELSGGQRSHFLTFYKLPLGDYQARLVKDPHKIDGTPMYQQYELVLPDNALWRCTVTGFSE